MDTFAFAYLLVVSFVLGTVMGSFINCWAWRFMHDESVLHGRSHCTSCGHELGPRDLVPVVSWLSTRGTCRYCGEHVSARYPATELISGLCYAAIAAKYGFSLETVELLAFASVLLFLSLTDIDDYLIPNACILVALGIRLVYFVVAYACGIMDLRQIGYYVLSGLGVGAVLLAVVLIADHVLGRESMGGGDLKLYAVAALYVGWQQSLFLVFLSCILGLASTLVLVKPTEGEKGGRGSQPFPFGPSIALATIITLLVGQDLVNWYLGLFR